MKRGSALLIVLGMLSFIVASAVAFSAYMRYARMPSSFLRRTSSSRLLAKAALAEAIDVIDNSIGNDRRPGQKGRTFVKEYRRITDDEENETDVIDYWQDRCFIGSGKLVSPGQTVSVLCTEALAYIPPSIINEVRYYSRRSSAAAWQTLGYDSGRFAFAAVDVSDFFDVNNVRCIPRDADGKDLYGRNSSDRGRITLSHAFENRSHTDDNTACSPDEWDEFMDSYLKDGALPLVSVADMNLAINAWKPTLSPFCQYIRTGASFATAANDDRTELLRNMNFITDSYFPMTNRVSGALDLARAKDQPFSSAIMNGKVSVNTLLSGGQNNFTRWMESPRSTFNNDPEYVQLCDYLDVDSVPASLALPTVERAPMVTGVSLDGDLALVVEKGAEVPKDATEGQQKVRYYTTPYTLKLVGQLTVDAGTVYPFKYGRDGENRNFQLQAAATITLVPKKDKVEDYALRNKAVVAQTCWTLDKGQKWANADEASSWTPLQPDRGAVIRCVSNATKIEMPPAAGPKTEKEAIAPYDTGVDFPAFGSRALASELPETACYPKMTCTFRTVTRKVRVVPKKGGGEEEQEIPNYKDTSAPVDRVGALPVSDDLGRLLDVAEVLEKEYVPTIQVWVRVFNGDGDTVDLVPACWRDDREPYSDMQDDMRGSAQYPFVRFLGSTGVKFSAESGELEQIGDGRAELSPQGYLADDPRFNYAPENLIALPSKSGEFKDIWFGRQRSGNRDGDIFMATSDAGYMQSAYELTHLVATCRGTSSYCGVADGSGYDGRMRTSFEACPANRAMWRTYSQYDDAKEIDRLAVINGTKGFRVSPYTQSPEILLAALANTPLNWWAASTNEAVNKVVHQSLDTAAKYSFSEMPGALVKVKHADLRKVAVNMISAFQDSNWSDAFDEKSHWWQGGSAAADDSETSSLWDVPLQMENGAQLHSVDRKFLHGFWKECLANRQQLFLVFVRAEPMMMGGGFEHSPPQLGARAMALVWRDPAQTSSDIAGKNGAGNGPRPHRTRILFYRQFD